MDFPNGRIVQLQGFRLVDAVAVANLADTKIVELEKQGFLASIHHALQSQLNFRLLLELAVKREGDSKRAVTAA